MKAKKLKNIFSQAIQNESLFQQQEQTPFKVGSHQIKAGWLANFQKQEYIHYVNSSLKLAQLQHQLEQLKEEGNRNLKQSPSKANMFKIATLKKKISNFELDKTSDITKINKMAKQNVKLKTIQPPSMKQTIVQKVSGMFNTSYLRKCELKQKNLLIQSKKNSLEFTKLNLQSCSIQLELKQSQFKTDDFVNYNWVQDYQCRLRLKDGSKLFCLYGTEETLNQLLKYLKFYNFQYTIQQQKSQLFTQLNKQFQQKIIALFGKKVRYYESAVGKVKHLSKQLNNNLKLGQSKYNNNSTLKPMMNTPKNTPKHNQIIHQFSPQTSEILFSPQLKHKKVSNMSSFRLRGKRGTVFYDQLNDNLDLSQIKLQSPVFVVSDLNLHLKEQIGQSDVDQEQESQKQVYNRKRTTNISVSGKLFHRNDSWKQDKFNINIHQISSGQDDNQLLKSNGSSKRSSPFNSGYFQHENHYKGSEPQLPRHSTSSLSSFHLQQDKVESQSDKINPNLANIINTILTPKSFNTTSSNSKSKGNGQRIKFCFRQRKLDMQGACLQIQMFYPYNRQVLKFSVLQLDPDIQMQKYKVICSQNKFQYVQNKKQSNNYMSYVPRKKEKQNQQKKKENNFQIFPKQESIQPYLKLSSDSDQFIFILKQQDEQFYLPFTLNVKTKYQVDQSQLIFIKNKIESDQKGSKRNYRDFYKFAAIMHLYIAPHKVELWNRITTTEFIKQYIQMSPMSPHYQFKQNFINRKKRIHSLRQQVNYKVVKNCFQMNDQKAFQKFIFKGIPQKILNKIQSELNIQNRNIQKFLHLNTKEIKMLEETLIPASLYDLRVFMKPIVLIQGILNIPYNSELKKRFQEVAIFCLYKTGNLLNFLTAFMKQVILKLQKIILNLKTQYQVVGVLQIYFQIQYQIDELFQQISKYF